MVLNWSVRDGQVTVQSGFDTSLHLNTGQWLVFAVKDDGCGLDAIELLTTQGIEVIYPQGQTCCGQPAYNSGYQAQAKEVALHQIKQFELDIPIVVISGSCGGMMRQHYQSLLFEVPGIQAFCDHIYEFSEFLVYVLNIQLFDTGIKERVALHTSCAARREMGAHKTSKILLEQLDNVELVEHQYESEYCGFGGTFAVKHGDISVAMVEDKTKHLLATDTVRYISGDWGCMMNIDGALAHQKQPLHGEHIASYLLERIVGDKRE
jgi:L-lactate dehydrogenase complex protein LldE